jgi:predicted  nucleic acid-binding Zn ribbon protein
MYQVTIAYRFKDRHDNDAVQRLWSLSAAYHQSGQLVGDIWISERRGRLLVTGVLHERDSLSPRNDSPAAVQARKALRRVLRSEPVISVAALLEGTKTCACSPVEEVEYHPAPHPLLPASPLVCRSCRGGVPLYRFQSRKDEIRDWLDLLGSELIWRGLHWAWMDSAEMEALGWKQIADPESRLGRLIRGRLRELEKRRPITAYYRLQSEYWTRKGRERTICPGCGGRWNEESDDRLSCKPCRLASGISSDGLRPDWWRPLPRHRGRPTRP